MALKSGLFGMIESKISISTVFCFRGLIVFLIIFAVYSATLSHNYSGDSLSYAKAVESGALEQWIKFSHLLIHPLGWIFYQLWRLFGWSGGAMLPLQILNALGGALCVGFVYAISHHFSNSSKVSTIVAFGFAFSGATWLLSTEAEFVTVPLAFKLFVLWLLLAAVPRRMQRPAYAVLLGMGIAVAMLFYLNSAFLVPVVIVGLLLRKELPWRVRKRQVILVLIAVLLLMVVALSLIGTFLWREGDKPDLWLSIGGNEYGSWGWFDFAHGSYAFLRSIALYSNLGMNDRTNVYLAEATIAKRVLFYGYYLIILAAAGFPLILAVTKYRQWWSAQKSRVGALTIWTVLYAAFAVYWVPGDLTFWLPVLVAWWLLVAQILTYVKLKTKHLIALAVGVALLLVLNAAFLILPHHVRHRSQQENWGQTPIHSNLMSGEKFGPVPNFYSRGLD
jgi:hypothetical protein